MRYPREKCRLVSPPTPGMVLYQRLCGLTHGGLNEAAIAAEAEASE